MGTLRFDSRTVRSALMVVVLGGGMLGISVTDADVDSAVELVLQGGTVVSGLLAWYFRVFRQAE